MEEIKKRYYIEMYILHQDCHALKLKKKFKEDILDVYLLVPFQSTNGSKLYDAIIRVKTSHINKIWDEMTTYDNIIPVDKEVVSGDYSNIYCSFRDNVFDIFSQSNGGTSHSYYLREYKLYCNYKFFGLPAEFFCITTNNKDFFLKNTLKYLKKVAINKKIDWRISDKMEIEKRIPGLSLCEQYILRNVLKNTKYFENNDREELISVADELGENIEKIERTTKELAGRVYMQFLTDFYKDAT